MAHPPESAHEVSTRLRTTGYLPDEGLSTITYLALAMQRPLLLEGEPGTGKTALAEALALLLDGPLIRLQCYAVSYTGPRSLTSRGRCNCRCCWSASLARVRPPWPRRSPCCWTAR